MSWKILDMQHKTSDGFVIQVSSCYEVKDGPGYARKVFLQNFEEVVGPDFIPYENLTEETVIGWVKESLGPEVVASTETEVSNEAANKKQEIEEPVVEGGTPWKSEDFDPATGGGVIDPQ
jgi:hypothetical protein